MCGIAGFVGKKTAYFPTLLKLLGLYQDTRGGDGCGFGYYRDKAPVVIKGAPYPELEVFKSISKLIHNNLNYPDTGTLFELLTKEINLPQDCEAILLHSRKSTVGLTTYEATHPFIIPKDVGSLIGVHNGTITNYKQLANILEIPETSVTTDSVVLLCAVAFNKLEDIYSDIKGAANLIWIDSDNPDVINVICTGDKATDRPLNALVIKDHGIYISSERHPLTILRGLLLSPSNTFASPTIVTLDPNILYKLSYKGIEVVKTFVVKKVNATKVDINNLWAVSRKILEDDTLPSYKNIVYFYRGIYWINGVRLATKYIIENDTITITDNYLFDKEGRKVSIYNERIYVEDHNNIEVYDKEIYELYFFNGVLLHSKTSLLGILNTYTNGNIPVIELKQESYYPIPSALNSIQSAIVPSGYFYSTVQNVCEEITPIFSTKIYYFRNNFVSNIIDISRKSAKRFWKKELQKFRYEGSRSTNV